ncbi:MAG: hypothetical protein OEV64_14290 [Desulfobulbaceae bacterium]|nr:hypothetical protein [Desulfobulbaceae bacterium]
MDRKKIELLHLIYLHAGEFHGTGWACKKGCSACCTQSVTMTTLEGREIVSFLKKRGAINVCESVSKAAGKIEIPKMTTNRFASLCIAEDDSMDVEQEESWNFSSCIFLKEGVCTIYEARPFSCRCFLSRTPCSEQGYAVMDPVTITLNSVFQQLIEHVDQGGYWGNLVHVVGALLVDSEPDCQQEEEQCFSKLLPCSPLPGFVISPEEQREVKGVLDRLFNSMMGATTFKELMDEVVAGNRYQ